MIVVAASASFDIDVPMIIIGAGAAGLIAALAAREAGADVLVLERDELPRGSTALSAGLIPAAGTRWQKAAGIEDSPDIFGADIMAKAHGEPDPAAVATVATQVGPVLEWLADRHGLEFSLVTDFNYPGHSVHRMHGLPARSGAAFMDALRSAAEAAGIEIVCNAHVTRLFADEERRIRGLEFQRPGGAAERAGCGALILACNGYGGNKALVAEHIPALSAGLYFGHPGNQGDAILWGAALGAATRHLSGHQGHGSVAEPGGILISWATITAGGFQVNLHGERFSNEMCGYSEQAVVVLGQPGGVAWTVFDARIAGIARQFEDFRQAEALGLILAAPDAGALAAQMRVPEAALRATMAEVAGLARARARDRFGRDFAGVPPLTPPLHAVRVTGALFHTQGGLVVDGQARVLTPAGVPLPNLFAAGGAAAGVSGNAASGYLSGNGLLTATALGFIAGQAAGNLIAQ
jgi:fumarate reductase flavoprotein subunit